MTIYFTADLHLGHEAIIQIAKRPFETVEEMDEALLGAINEHVAEGDELWILGDATCRIPKEKAEELLRRIRCRRVHLVRGNHDRDWSGSGVFASFQDYEELKAEGRKLALFHYPIAEWNGFFHDWSLHLHGHIHSGPEYNEGNRAKGLRAFDVGVDANGYAPVSLEEILAFFEEGETMGGNGAAVALHGEIRRAMTFFEGHAFRSGFLEADACRELMACVRSVDEALCEGAGGQAWEPREWAGIERPEGFGVDERGAQAAFGDGASWLLWCLARVGADRAVAYLSEYREAVLAVSQAAERRNPDDGEA